MSFVKIIMTRIQTTSGTNVFAPAALVPMGPRIWESVFFNTDSQWFFRVHQVPCASTRVRGNLHGSTHVRAGPYWSALVHTASARSHRSELVRTGPLAVATGQCGLSWLCAASHGVKWAHDVSRASARVTVRRWSTRTLEASWTSGLDRSDTSDTHPTSPNHLTTTDTSAPLPTDKYGHIS